MDIPGTVNAILEAKGWTHDELAGALGVTQPAVTRWAAGTSFPRGPNYEKLKDLAEQVLGGDAPLDQARPVRAALVPTPVSGKVSAGLFQEIDDFENQDPEEVLVARDPRYPNARMVVFDVDGNSMNAFDPPIPDGARVSGPVFEDIRVVPRNGMAVIIQRRSADGQMLEWSVKEIEVRDDGYTFHPRSTDLRYKPIVVDTDLQADDGKTVEIIALVTDVWRPVRW